MGRMAGTMSATLWEASQRGRGVDRDMGGRLETRDDSSAGITAGGGGRRVRLVEPSGRST